MRIAFGTDERTATTDAIKLKIQLRGELVMLGEGDPWPDVARAVGEAVVKSQVAFGIVCCWTGTGVSIAANKVDGVRAALCTDAETARGRADGTTRTSSRWACGSPAPTVAEEMIDAFLDTEPDPAEA